MPVPHEEVESVNKHIPNAIALFSYKYPVLSNLISAAVGALIGYLV